MRAAWIARKIESDGRAVIGVFPNASSKDPINDSFAYTIGNALHGMPEVLVVGMYNQTACWLLNRVSEEMQRGFRTGDLDLGGARAVHVLPANEEAKAAFTIQATNWHGSPEAYELSQVVIPDPDGRFPWDKDCGKPFASIRVWRRLAS